MIEGFLLNVTMRFLSLFDDPAGLVGRPDAPPLEVVEGVQDAATQVTQAAQPTGGDGGIMLIVIYAAVMIIALYFLMFRGPRKREKKMREMQSSIRTGDNVVVTGGMFGRIADVGDDCFIVEFGTNRGIRIPVLKSDVLGVREPKLTPPPKTDTE